MSILLGALAWLATPANWLGESGILTRSAQHLGLTALIVTLATLIAVPLGTWIGHTGRGRWLVSATGAARAVPTLGVLTLAGLWLGIGHGGSDAGAPRPGDPSTPVGDLLRHCLDASRDS